MSSERTLTAEELTALCREQDEMIRQGNGEIEQLRAQLAACEQERDEARRQLDGYMESICGDLADMCHCRLDKDHPGPHLGYWGGDVVQWADSEPADGWHKTRDMLEARAEAAEAALAELRELVRVERETWVEIGASRKHPCRRDAHQWIEHFDKLLALLPDRTERT